MRQISRICVGIIATFALALTTAGAAAETRLTPHRAHYKVKISVVSGRLDTELRATEHGYVATHVIRPVGVSKVLTRGEMNVTSEFIPESDGVRPVRYHAIDTIRDEPEADIEFDWTSNVASGTVGNDRVEFHLDGISHDSVSIQYELMYDLLNGGPSSQYTLFDVEKMRVANVRNVGTRTVKTDAGTFEVVGIQHQREGSSRVTTLWCARELGYLPVVVEQHRKGKLNFRATLEEYDRT